MAVDLSTAILQLSENGELQRIHDKWLVKNSCSSDTSEIDSDRLRFKSFWGLFLICGIVCFVALSIYFLQIMLRFCHSAPTQPANGSAKSGRFQRFLSLIDEKEDQSKVGSRKRVGAQRSSEEDDLERQSKRIQTNNSTNNI